MKFTKSIIVLALIVLSAVHSLDRTEKRNKVKAGTNSRTKDDGSGSWSSGYDCPAIFIAKDNGSLAKDGNGKFYAQRLETPNTNIEKIGWVFEMGSIGETLKKVMFQDGSSNRWYLPFRYITGGFSYTNPWFNNKYVEGTVQNDNKETYRFKLNLPYKTFGWYINDDEATKITTLLNSARVVHRNIVTSSKTGATNAAGDYISNKPVYDNIVSQGSNIQAARTSAETQKANYNTELVNQSAQLKELEKSTSELEAQLTAKKGEQSNLQQNMLGLSTQMISIESALKSLEGEGVSKEQQISNFRTKVDNSLATLDTQINALKVEAPERNTEIAGARSAVITLNLNEFNANLNKIVP